MTKTIRFCLCALVLLAAATGCGPEKGESISVEDFGAVADDGLNDIEALGRAAEYCRNNKVSEMIIPAGVYDIIDEEALRIEREAISGAYGNSVQSKLFRPDAPYVKALDLSGLENVSIKAQGATLLLHGWYEVVSLVRSKNVSLEGLSIRYKRQPATVGLITAAGKGWFEGEFDTEKYYYIDSLVTGRLHCYDALRSRLYTCWYESVSLIAPGKLRFESERPVALGDNFILRHGGHYRAAVFIKESENIALKGVKIHGQPGMGVVGHRTENILLEGLQVVPEAGAVISTNTDATHFTSCTGTITLKDCKFRGQGDDCTNIHNYYYHIYPESPRRAEIRIEGADLHALSLDYPDVGDTMTVLSNRSMAEQGQYIVRKVDTCSTEWKVVVELDKDLPEDASQNYIMTNRSRFPKVEILNNSVQSHLARAFLIKSRNVHIAGNTIVGSVGTAIKLGAELSWMESGPAENVLIENNYISGCGYGSRTDATCITLSTEALDTPPHLNKNIVIRDNVFDTQWPERAVVLKDAESVLLERNSLPAYKGDYIIEENCSDVIK